MRSNARLVLLLTVLLAGASEQLYAAENRVPTAEEFRELVRQYNESGGSFSRPRATPLSRPAQKAVEDFNRAVSLHSKAGASAGELKEAAALYQAAADAGLPQASSNLALLYLEGKGVKKDVKKALSLLNDASRKNDSQADIVLARTYLVGKDVKMDEKKGVMYLNRAVKAGNQNAVKMLAEYKDWKKKNEQSMKQIQELMKQAQANQAKTQSLPLTAAPSVVRPPPAFSPFRPKAPEPPLVLFPGLNYLEYGTAAAQSPQPLKVDIPAQGQTIMLQPGKPGEPAPQGSAAVGSQILPKPANLEPAGK